jgi:hypothetical protein
MKYIYSSVLNDYLEIKTGDAAQTKEEAYIKSYLKRKEKLIDQIETLTKSLNKRKLELNDTLMILESEKEKHPELFL